VTVEDEYFPPPRELRELLRGVATGLELSLAAPVQSGNVLADDRSVPASSVLA
jgi:hypothetical protein